MYEKNLCLSNGYEIKLETIIRDYENGILALSNNAHDFVCAHIYNNNIILKKGSWMCPYCSHTNKISSNYSVSKDTLEDIIYSQTNLFEYDKIVLVDEFQYLNNKVLECNHCGNLSHQKDQTQKLKIVLHNNSIKLCLKLDDIKQLLECKIIDGDLLDIATKLPLNETLTLDFIDCKIVNAIEDDKGNIIESIQLYELKNTRFHDLINNYCSIKNCIYDMLNEIWAPSEFPFERNEITTDLLVTLVNFVGYPNRTFYDGIPFALNERKVYSSFSSIAQRLSHYKGIANVFEKSRLPNFKSVKRILLNTPELMFYLEEIEKLWDLLSDGNLLVTLLTNENCFKMLAMLHLYPHSYKFFYDYIYIKSTRSLTRLLAKNDDSIIIYAINYISLRDEAKNIEKRLWNNSKFFKYNELLLRCFIHIPFSLPLKYLNSDFRCKIDSYDFLPIRTVKECHEAGAELNNCLVNYDSNNNPVVCVKKNDKILAAIEIKNSKQIIQAYAKNNTEIADDSELSKAVSKYYKRNNLKWLHDDF